MAKKYNWAILGCGNIAKKFSTELKDLPNANLYATASRNIENAQNFATEFGFQKAYGSYQEMVEDLMAIVHTFSCRLDGMRKYKNAIHTDFPQYTLQPPKDELQ